MSKELFIDYLIDILIYPDEFIIDEYSNSEFYKYNKLYFYYNSNNDFLYCSYERVWNVFEETYGLNYNEIQDLLKDMLLNSFNMGATTSLYMW